MWRLEKSDTDEIRAEGSSGGVSRERVARMTGILLKSVRGKRNTPEVSKG